MLRFEKVTVPPSIKGYAMNEQEFEKSLDALARAERKSLNAIASSTGVDQCYQRIISHYGQMVISLMNMAGTASPSLKFYKPEHALATSWPMQAMSAEILNSATELGNAMAESREAVYRRQSISGLLAGIQPVTPGYEKYRKAIDTKFPAILSDARHMSETIGDFQSALRERVRRHDSPVREVMPDRDHFANDCLTLARHYLDAIATQAQSWQASLTLPPAQERSGRGAG